MDLTPNKYHQALAYLTINSSFLGDLGLFHGKIGIVLFFAHYARISNSKHYEDFAGHLLDEIYKEIHLDLPVNLENGLCGIGWGIEYLVQHGFMEGNTDEILADIDRKVMEINPQRISDLSFRRGLLGIAFYVLARLNATRKTNVMPFDNAYLISLQEALHNVKSTEEKKILEDLKNSFSLVTKEKKITLHLPYHLIHSHLSLKKSIDSIPLGIENGLTGWLWSNINSIKINFNISVKEKCICLFEEESRSTKYGIGTYVNQLINILKNTEWQITRIRLFAIKDGNNKDTIKIKMSQNIIYIDIIGFRNGGYQNDNSELIKRYYRNTFYVLSPYFAKIKHPIFHVNSMQSEYLVFWLKKYFKKSMLILTVHYTNWSFELLGNQNTLKAILKSHKDYNKKSIYRAFKSEKKLMTLCDKIIAIAQHSYNDITTIYQIPKEKVTLIPHNLYKDAFRTLSSTDRFKLRQKYKFSQDEKIIIFAGRIDLIKGIDFLIESFLLLTKQHPKLQLIIAGDGNHDLIFPKLKHVWSKVTYTGFIDKSTLYELFLISDIGVMPSLHEEFGFVALEMMMMNLPIVANHTTGLSELIIDGETGILVPLTIKEKEKSIQLLTKKIDLLLQNNSMRMTLAKAGRLRFLKTYYQNNSSYYIRKIYNNNNYV